MMSGELRADGRSVAGANHLRAKRPCQDALCWERRSGVLALAVADGHGSSPRGGEGASLAVRVAVEWLLNFHQALEPGLRGRLGAVRELALEPFGCQLVQEWTRRVLEADGRGDEALRDHGTTLLAVLVAPEFVLYLQLGDGDILRVDAEGQVSRVLEKDPLHFANETASLCSPRAWRFIHVAVHPPLAEETLLLLATDGYANSYESDEVFERMGPDYLARVRERGFEAVIAELPEILEQVTTQGSGDDITLGLVHLMPAVPGNTAARIS
jgi:hypothetical protein